MCVNVVLPNSCVKGFSHTSRVEASSLSPSTLTCRIVSEIEAATAAQKQEDKAKETTAKPAASVTASSEAKKTSTVSLDSAPSSNETKKKK